MADTSSSSSLSTDDIRFMQTKPEQWRITSRYRSCFLIRSIEEKYLPVQVKITSSYASKMQYMSMNGIRKSSVILCFKPGE